MRANVRRPHLAIRLKFYYEEVPERVDVQESSLLVPEPWIRRTTALDM